MNVARAIKHHTQAAKAMEADPKTNARKVRKELHRVRVLENVQRIRKELRQ